MKKSVLLITSLISALSIFIAAPQAVYACSCMAAGTPQKSLEQSSAVFLGTATNVSGSENQSVTVTFDVQNAWKGVESNTVTISTPQDSAMCGVTFEVGKTYVVYAYQNDEDGTLQVNLCSRTHEVLDNDEDIAALGTVAPVATPETPAPISSKTKTTALVIIAALAVVSIAIEARKKRHS